MADKTFFVLAVALLTWGSVFVYLLRLDKLTRALEEEVRAHAKSRSDETVASPGAES